MSQAELDDAIEAKIRGVLASRGTLFLSTSANEQPWVAGTFFADLDPFTLAVVLETTGRTLTNIRANPHVGVVVSSGSPYETYLQGEGEAVVLTTADETETTKQALLAKAPEIAPFFGYPFVAVMLRMRRWRATDVLNGWVPGRELAAPAPVAAP